jgi:tetratricopeptide (TPR) repeat protein
VTVRLALLFALVFAAPAAAGGPGEAAALVARGQRHRQQGDFDRALADFAAAARALPPADTDLLQAATLVDARRAHQAMIFLDRHLARHPDSAAGYLERARADEAIVAPQAAADDYQRALDLIPHPTLEQYLHRVRLQHAAGRPEAALGGLDEAIAQLGPLPELEKPAIALEMEARRWEQALARLKSLPPPVRAALASVEKQARRELSAASRPAAGGSKRSRDR